MKIFYLALKSFFLLMLLFLACGLFAATPIQSRAIRGVSAGEARLRLLASAESYLGTPYRFGGVDRRGLDCSGFVHLSFRDGLQYTIPRTSEAIYNWAQNIPTSELQPGDLVFFVTVGTRVSHLGIYVGGGRFIHSASEGPHTGVIYSRLDESYWRRTFRGAGRALPWDDEAAQAIAAARPGGNARPGGGPTAGSGGEARPATGSGGIAAARPNWADPGFFTGFGAAWIWGGGAEGPPSAFRGISALATVGYKWPNYRFGLELRPQVDSSLGVFRLPFTMSLGTDSFWVFGGSAYVFGEPRFELDDGSRRTYEGGAWLLELGFAGAFRPFHIGPGALSLYGEMAWQSYRRGEGQEFQFRPDFAANLRASTGLRYLWRL